MPGYLRGFRAWLRRSDPALLHANTLLALPELVARPWPGPPAVLHSHEVLPKGPRGALAGRLARRADSVVAVSHAAASTFARRGVRATVVHPGVELPPEAGTGPHIVAGGRREGSLVVGTLGTVCRRKGSDLFLSAAKRLGGRSNALEFRIVGEPVVGGGRPWAEAVLDAARAAGVVHRSRVEPYAELAEWDVFVLPSRMDPAPLAVLEAMAVGLPVVGARVGGIPEELGEAGLLVEPEDVEGLAAAVELLAADPGLRAALGDAARRRVEHLFTIERQADGLESAYRAALEAI